MQVILHKSSSLLDSKWTWRETSVVSSITQSEFALKRYSYVCIYLALTFYLHAKISHSVKTEASALIVKYHSTKTLAQVERCQNYNVQTATKLWLLLWNDIRISVLIVHERLTDKGVFCCHRAPRVWTLI